MKSEISGTWSLVALFTLLSLTASAEENGGLVQSLMKRISSTRSGLASELSPQHKDLTSRLVGKGLMKTVKIHNDFVPFLNCSDAMDPITAEKINGLIEFSVNGYPLKKHANNSDSYTLIPVRYDQPLQIQMSLNRGNATSLLDILKNKAKTQGVHLPSWTDSRFMNLINLVSCHFIFERPLDRETEDYFLSVILCEQEDFAQLISDPTTDMFYDLAKKYGQPGWFDISFNLPRIKPIDS